MNDPSSRRTAWVLLSVLVLLGPGHWGIVDTLASDEPSVPRGNDAGRDWPPEAWEEGDISDLTLLEMTLLLAGLEAGHPAEEEAKQQLARLDDLPPRYEDIARTSLEGMTRAFWHQYQAIRDLPPEQQRSLLAAAHDDPVNPGLGTALDAMDTAEVLKAAAALMDTARDIEHTLDVLDRDPRSSGLAEALSPHLDLDASSTHDDLPQDVKDLEPLDALASRLAGIDPGAGPELSAALDEAPPAGVEAIHRILAALEPVHEAAEGSPREEALLTLAQVVDSEYELLRIWSGMATARSIHEQNTEPPLRFLDPNADTPPLRIGLSTPHWDRPLPTPEPRPLPEALAALARTLGDHATAAQADELTAPLQLAMEQGEQDALSRLLDAIDAYIHHDLLAKATPLPQPLRNDTALLARWAHDLDEGNLPEPGTREAAQVLKVADYLQIQQRAEAALEEMLAAAEEIVPTFTTPTSSSGLPVPGGVAPAQDEEHPVAPTGPVDDTVNTICEDPADPVEDACDELPGSLQESCDDAPSQLQDTCVEATEDPCRNDPQLEQFVIPPYIAFDLCGTDTVWEDEHQAMVAIDIGGDDTYLHRAGAPFMFMFTIESQTIEAGGQSVSVPGDDRDVPIPVSSLFDLDGNDTYDSQGRDCAQGAACANASDVSPVSVLVDWSGDGVDQHNEFIAGNRSQGYAGADGGRNAYAALIERTGASSSLSSSYTALNQSQGVADAFTPSNQHTHPTGILSRLVGDDSNSHATFAAGNVSQGAADRVSHVSPSTGSVNTNSRPALGMFLSSLGASTNAEHEFTAGNFSQGAVASPTVLLMEWTPTNDILDYPGFAVFASLAGPGATSRDAYHAQNRSRGWVEVADLDGLPPEDAFPFAFFIDAVTNQELDLQETAKLEDGELTVGPHQGGHKNGTYTPLRQGHGWGLGRFIDVGGQDTYERDPDAPANKSDRFGFQSSFNIDLPDPESPIPHVEDPDSAGPLSTRIDLTLSEGPVPRNDAIWAQPHEDGMNLDEVLVTNTSWTGIDIDHMDRDADLMPTFLEQVWDDWIGLWPVDEQDPGRSPLPVQPCVVVDLVAAPVLLDEPCGFVLSTGGSDRFGPDFSTAVLFNLGGDDLYEGRSGAAAALPEDAGLGLPVSPDGSPDGPPIATGLAFHLDMQGDDVYRSPWSRTFGYGEGGATGILFDLGGDDTFVAPNHTQGVGVNRGLGVLATTQTPDAQETNRFLALSPPAHGKGVDGGVGILASTADDNRFGATHSDETALEEDEQSRPTGGAGVTAAQRDEAANEPPGVVGLEVPESSQEQPLQAGHPNTFTAQAVDPDDDPLRFCWRIEHGDGVHEECSDWTDGGTHTVTYAWTDVRATEDLPEPVYRVNVSVTDPLGAQDKAQRTVNLTEAPIPRTGALRGPRTFELSGVSPMTGAYHVPIDPAHLDRVDRIEVDWGDGRNTTQPFDLHAIDWALGQWGARVNAPGTVQMDDASEAGDRCPGSSALEDFPWSNALDGNPETLALFQFGGISGNRIDCPPVHAVIEFDGPRQVAQVEVSAHVRESSQIQDPEDTELLVEGLRPNGSTIPLGTMHVEPRPFEDTVPTTGTFPVNAASAHGLEEIAGVVIRQLVPDGKLPDRGNPENLFIHGVHAFGPGVEGTWRLAGSFDMEYRIVSEFGAVNASQAHVQVGQETKQFFDYNDFASRGDVAHASVATDHTYTLNITRIDTLEAVDACIDWDDGSQPACEPFDATEAWEPRHRWDEPGTYNVQFVVQQTDGPGRVEFPLVKVDVLPVFDLTVAGNPILFLQLEEDNPRTWYSGDRAYYAIVDRSGDSRYFGQVAAPRTPLDTQRDDSFGLSLLAQMPRPGFVYDHEGEDFYLSPRSGAQGFGSFGGIGLLYDRQGDDIYIAPGKAQGAGEGHGIGILIDSGGNDAYTPIPFSHPDAQAGLPTEPDPWPEPPPSLKGSDQGRRAALWVPEEDRPFLTQGAATDGLGILMDNGGQNIFSAGTHAQGYADRALTDWRKYAFADPDCVFAPTLDGFPPTFNPDQTACMLGITEPRPGNPDPNNPELPSAKDEPFRSFLGEGERMGPAAGVLLTANGASTYQADALAQGAAQPGGRGLLVDLDGGTAATVNNQAQGYARAGDHVAWKQGPNRELPDPDDVEGMVPGPDDLPDPDDRPDGEEIEAKLEEELSEPPARAAAGATGAIYSGGPFNWRAGRLSQNWTEEPSSPTTMNDPPVGVAIGAVEQEKASAECAIERKCGPALNAPSSGGLPPPTLAWDEDTTNLLEKGTLDSEIPLQATLTSSILGDSFGAQTETALILLPRSVAMNDEGERVCGWPVIGPPVFVPVDLEGNTMTANLDLYENLSDGPGIPSGCLELQLLARETHAAGAASVWGQASGTLIAEPPPRLSSAQASDEFLSPGQTVEIEAVLDQPRAAAVHAAGAPEDPDMEWIAVAADSSDNAPCAQAQENPSEPDDAPQRSRDEGIRTHYTANWTPSDEGVYTICARAKWSGTGENGWGQWEPIQDIIVDAQAPAVAAFVPDPPVWQYGRPLPVNGSVMAGNSGLQDALEIRLWQPGNPELGRIAGPVTVPGIQAGPGETATWNATFTDFRSGMAGPALLQVNATSGAGVSTGWTDVGEVVLDGAPPVVEGAWTHETGTNATRLEHDPVIVTVALTDDESGVDPESVIGILSQPGSDPHVLRFVPDDEVGEAKNDPRCTQNGASGILCVHLEWNVDDPEEIEEGANRIVVHAADQVGNLMTRNPGLEFVIDRTQPLLWNQDIDLPEAQTAVKPGDSVNISFHARTSGGHSSLYQVVVRIGDPDAPLQENTYLFDGDAPHQERVHPDPDIDERYRIEVPIDQLGGDALLLPIQVELRDRALNPALGESEIHYRGLPPEILDMNLTRRADALWFDWSTDREVENVQATLVPSTDSDETIAGEFQRDGLDYSIRFSDLTPGTDYDFVAEHTDEAGWIVQHQQTVSTLPPLDGGVDLAPEPTDTHARVLDVHGSVHLDLAGQQEQIPVNAALYVIGPGADPLDALDGAPLDEDDFLLTPQNPSASFSFEWDTQDRPSGTHQVVLIMDDAITFRTDTWNVRTDNDPPETGFEITGPQPRGGWYNGTVSVQPKFTDDTPPVDLQTWIDGEPVDGSEPITFSDGGIYTIDMRVRDAAVPPNEEDDTFTLRVDRSPPELDARIDLPHPAVSNRSVPLHIAAEDPLSGIEAFRAGTNETRPSWTTEAPKNVTLPEGPDGPRWIQVDVRDVAGNERHKALAVTLDRIPPELVLAWWSGHSPDGEPVLDFVARDTLDGPGRPSGVSEIRFASPDRPESWSPWYTTNGIGSIPVPPAFTTPQGALIQMSDRAGNIAEPLASPSVPAPRDPDEPNAPPSPTHTSPPPAELLQEPEDRVPRTAHADEVLTFTIHVHPWDDTWPDHVWLMIGDTRIPMTPDDETREDGSKVYRAEVTATASTLDSTPDYWFVADFGGDEVRTQARSMPTTALLGLDENAGTQDVDEAEGIPGQTTALLLAALLSGILLLRRPLPHGRMERGETEHAERRNTQ